MTAEDVLDLDIADVVYRGLGLARREGLVYFVPGTLPGERVRARITQRHKRHVETELLDVLAAAADRVEPACPLALRPGCGLACPGCAYQHAGYAAEVNLKQAQLADFLTHQAGLREVELAPPAAASQPLGYRNKIVLHAAGTGGEHALGYVATDNRTILDVPRCPLAVAPINAALAELRAAPPPAVPPGRRIRHTLRYTARDGVRRFVNRPPRSAPWLTEESPVGPLRVPPSAFYQVNPLVAALLVGAVQDVLAARQTRRVVDAYGGVGLFALAAARAGAEEVLLIDSDAAAAAAAAHNARRLLDSDSLHVLHADAAEGLTRALAVVAPEEVTVIVDPPRRGLEPAALAAIVRASPACVLYVSCAPDTLARDLKRLTAAGYRLRSARLFDMFPRTAAFETLAVIERVDGAAAPGVCSRP